VKDKPSTAITWVLKRLVRSVTSTTTGASIAEA